MGAARHFFKAGTCSDDDLAEDIKSDIAAAHGARREAESHGQHQVAGEMAKATDEYLDELNDVNNGSWRPKHA
ncbi:hypothetical protein ACFYWU_05600 [Streptomyces chrestomyceticus]|uniref:hypothetical protein n=1 Tax=Streptomyces chrestomyceticus TaxID=68185 RepID=UPI00368A3463